MKQEDAAYFLKSAETELDLAQKATHPDVVSAHYLLAGHYLDKVYGEDCCTS